MIRSSKGIINFRLYCLAACFLLVTSSGFAADEELDALRAAHRSARESIHTFSAKVTNERTVPKNELILESTYWRHLDTVRIQARPGGGTTDFLVKDSEMRQVLATAKDRAGRQTYTARRYPKSNLIALCDVWGQMLIDFYRPEGGPVDFDRFLGHAKESPRIKKERLGGVECLRLNMSIAGAQGETRYVIWHDITRNYLVRKLEMTFSEFPKSHLESENTEFTEAAPGIFMPIRCVRGTREGNQYSECATTLSDVRINEPIPDSVFTLPAIPSGTLMDDYVEGTRYRVDSNWRKIGPAERLVTTTETAPSTEAGGTYRTPSTREPRSLAWWLVPASLVLVFGSGIVLVYRRFRRRAYAE